MIGQTDLSLYQAGLPQEKIWSKEKVKRAIVKQAGSLARMHEDSTYSINPQMIALYDFSQEPLLGKYQTVIFDQERGIVLSRKSSRQLVHDFFRNKLLFGASFQKHINEMLGFKYHHIISVWQTAYFSLNGYFDQNTDWISLHHISDYQVNKQEISFITTVGYRFEFNNCCRHLPARLGEGITHNWILGQIIKESLHELGLHLRACKRLKRSSSILDDEAYLMPRRLITYDEVMLKQIITKLEDLDFKQIGRAISHLFDVPVNESDLKLLKRISKRQDSIY
ncbi:hypothetical protein [Lactobacillus sp. PV034]|uniref:hypothetical protein n=1 Tax=Lactobacillus sp. PV034 TaxID=2594495 RepID=UPI00223EA670|nr:hypothetical protein [Lactobacillus sp. PV034]QNQ80539.1 hypothetical protein FP432_02720 [Lactobacillus sp. PV034]